MFRYCFVYQPLSVQFYRFFSQPLQSNSATVPQIRPLILPSTSFPVHESPYRSTLHSLRYCERCSINEIKLILMFIGPCIIVIAEE